jgi:hypothetical protein
MEITDAGNAAVDALSPGTATSASPPAAVSLLQAFSRQG